MMSIITLKHKCLSIILIWVIVSHCVSKKVKKNKKNNNTFLNWETEHGKGKKVAIFDWEWGRNSAPREG